MLHVLLCSFPRGANILIQINPIRDWAQYSCEWVCIVDVQPGMTYVPVLLLQPAIFHLDASQQRQSSPGNGFRESKSDTVSAGLSHKASAECLEADKCLMVRYVLRSFGWEGMGYTYIYAAHESIPLSLDVPPGKSRSVWLAKRVQTANALSGFGRWWRWRQDELAI